MSEIVQLLSVLQNLSPLAVIALLAVIILMLVRNKRAMGSIKDNDLHEVTGALNRIETRLIAMNDCLVWIKARMNGDR